MPDQPTARLVSGEIMTGVASRRPGALTGETALDADFVTVWPVAEPRPGPAAEAQAIPASADLRSPRPTPRPPAAAAGNRAGPLFWTLGMCIVGAAFWTSGGHALMRPPPAAAPQQTLSPSKVRIVSVSSQVVADGGPPGLLVSGEMVNESGEAVASPPLAILVTAGNGARISHIAGASGSELGAGARSGFSQRLDLPKNGVVSVEVTVAR